MEVLRLRRPGEYRVARVCLNSILRLHLAIRSAHFVRLQPVRAGERNNFVSIRTKMPKICANIPLILS